MTSTPRPEAPPTDPTRVIQRLCRDLAALRLQYANLLAAARATLSAVRDDEPDALDYLTDELAAQHGQHDLNPDWRDALGQWDEVGR
jgi:hypothetical protein